MSVSNLVKLPLLQTLIHDGSRSYYPVEVQTTIDNLLASQSDAPQQLTPDSRAMVKQEEQVKPLHWSGQQYKFGINKNDDLCVGFDSSGTIVANIGFFSDVNSDNEIYNENTIYLWKFEYDISSGCQKRIAFNSARTNIDIWSLAFHPKLPILAIGSENRTNLWYYIDNKALILEEHISINSVVFHSNGKFMATGGNDGMAKLWRVSQNGTRVDCVATIKVNSLSVESVAFHPTAPLLAIGCYDGSVRLWRFASDLSDCSILLKRVVKFQASDQQVLSMDFHPDGQFLVTGGPLGAKLWILPAAITIETVIIPNDRMVDLRHYKLPLGGDTDDDDDQDDEDRDDDDQDNEDQDDDADDDDKSLSPICVSILNTEIVTSVGFHQNGKFLVTLQETPPLETFQVIQSGRFGNQSYVSARRRRNEQIKGLLQFWDCRLLTDEGRRSELLATSKFAQVVAKKIGVVKPDLQENILRRVMSQKNQALAVSLLTDEQSQDKALANKKKPESQQNGGKISRRNHKNRNNIQAIRKSRK